jgi:hypothetical protein
VISGEKAYTRLKPMKEKIKLGDGKKISGFLKKADVKPEHSQEFLGTCTKTFS